VKKNNHSKTYFKYLCFCVTATFLFLATSCNFEDVSSPKPDPPEPDPPADTVGTVAPDGILEAVTWNLEWFGTGNSNPDNFGPDNEQLQLSNALLVIDSLKADLYGFQEINNKAWLDSLTSRMEGFSGIIADHITYNQRTAFVYNTRNITPISAGPITEFQDEDEWAGRFPFFFRFEYKRDDNDTDPLQIYAVVIHAKAGADQDDYNRRVPAAESLHTFLTRNQPDANIIFLGDYNDDVDESIYRGEITPYLPFVEDEENFFVITKSLSEEMQSTTVGFPDAVDHITVSNELEPFFIPDSETALVPTDDFINDYGETTSDHYPVIARFDIRR